MLLTQLSGIAGVAQLFGIPAVPERALPQPDQGDPDLASDGNRSVKRVFPC